MKPSRALQGPYGPRRPIGNSRPGDILKGPGLGLMGLKCSRQTETSKLYSEFAAAFAAAVVAFPNDFSFFLAGS